MHARSPRSADRRSPPRFASARRWTSEAAGDVSLEIPRAQVAGASCPCGGSPARPGSDGREGIARVCGPRFWGRARSQADARLGEERQHCPCAGDPDQGAGQNIAHIMGLDRDAREENDGGERRDRASPARSHGANRDDQCRRRSSHARTESSPSTQRARRVRNERRRENSKYRGRTRPTRCFKMVVASEGTAIAEDMKKARSARRTRRARFFRQAGKARHARGSSPRGRPERSRPIPPREW